MNEEVAQFYDDYGEREWKRQEIDSYSHLDYLLHLDFIQDALQKGKDLVDIGSGSGRYSIDFAKAKMKVSLVDISRKQLQIANRKLREQNLLSYVEGFYESDAIDIPQIKDQSQDVAVCYGAPLSYLLKNRGQAVSEMYRVLRPGGDVFVSVLSKWGVIKSTLGNEQVDFFKRPDYWKVPHLLQTGDLLEHERVLHPPRHYFTMYELTDLMQQAGFTTYSLGASPCLTNGNMRFVNRFEIDDPAFLQLVELEKDIYKTPSALEMGEFLLYHGKKM